MPGSDLAGYSLEVFVSLGGGSSCTRLGGHHVTRDGHTINVALYGLADYGPDLACTLDMATGDAKIPLGKDFSPGGTYTVVINGETVTRFVAHGGAVSSKESEPTSTAGVPATIRTVEVIHAEQEGAEYFLEIESGLGLDRCMSFGGFQVSREGSIIAITLTNLEAGEDGPACMPPWTIVKTKIPLGRHLTPGEAYVVVVNGDVTNSFVPQVRRDRDMRVKLSPFQTAEVKVSESKPAQYSLAIQSRFPRGSSCSQVNGYDMIRRPGGTRYPGTIEITLTHHEIVDRDASCSRDVPVLETQVPLGDSFKPGESYDVSLNQVVVAGFVVQ